MVLLSRITKNEPAFTGVQAHQCGPVPVGPISHKAPLRVAPVPSTCRTPHVPHVLVMDNNEEVLELLSQVLEEESYRVTLATSLLDPAWIVELAPDVIVTDALFHLQPDGLRFIEAFRKAPESGHIPIVCCTTLRQVPESLAALGVPVISKPFDLDDFVRTVADIAPQPGGRQPDDGGG